MVKRVIFKKRMAHKHIVEIKCKVSVWMLPPGVRERAVDFGIDVGRDRNGRAINWSGVVQLNVYARGSMSHGILCPRLLAMVVRFKSALIVGRIATIFGQNRPDSGG